MTVEKNLILSAFLRGVPSKEIMVYVSLVWELGYQTGTAEMLADEWGRGCWHPRRCKVTRGQSANDILSSSLPGKQLRAEEAKKA